MNERTCLWPECTSANHQARGYCRIHYVYWRRAQKLNTQHKRTCTECGATFTTEKLTQTVCSRTCRAKSAQRGTTAVRYPDRVTTIARRTLNQVAPTVTVRQSGEGAWTAGTCRVCGTPYVSRLRAVTCSPVCQAIVRADYVSEKSHRRRARERDAYVSRVVRSLIYLRDQHTCQLCGDAVPMTLKAPDPMAPTLDHIIPLALGGTHEPSNAQLAHFICNSTKRDTMTLIA